MMIDANTQSDFPIPPGEYLEEVIEEIGMTKDELAQRMGRPASKLSAIFKGEKAVTPDTALRLEKVLGVPAHIWTGLEAQYRLALARQEEKKEEENLKKESKLTSKFCYTLLADLGLVGRTTKPIEKVLELQRFFGVTSLRNLTSIRRYAVAWRRGCRTGMERSPEALAAWLRAGEISAQRIVCVALNKDKLKKTIQSLRTMTQQSPSEFMDPMRKQLAEAGVALVLCPHFPKTYAHGATFWLGRDKAVVVITNRGKWADVFWFSFFHEIGHITLHDRQTVFVEGGDDDSQIRKQEEEADRFAADILILPSQYEQFVRDGRFDAEEICHFSRQIGIHAGIVVGRLQHDGYIPNSWHNRLRVKYEWSE